MRSRLAVIALSVIGALFALTQPAQALSFTGASPKWVRDAGSGSRLASPRGGSMLGRAVDPIGPFQLSGSLLQFDGSPGRGEVFWGWYDQLVSQWFGVDDVFHVGGSTEATDDGGFSFPSVTSVPGSDDLWAIMYIEDQVEILNSWTEDFSTGAPVTLRPGSVQVTLAHRPSAFSFMAGVGDIAHSAAWTDLAKTDTVLAGTFGPDFVTAIVRAETRRNTSPAAVGWVSPGHTPVPAGAGQESSGTISLDWDDAVRGELSGPVVRHSGPVGSRVTFILDDWPAGTEVSFLGNSFGAGTSAVLGKSVTSEGRDHTYRASLTIPDSALPGEVYVIDAYRSDDPQALLEVYDYFLVCDFGATRTVVTRGDSIRLRGQVEGNGVDLFKRTAGPAPQPSAYSAPGWTKVRSFPTHGNGRFRTGVMRPGRTTWYVARYSGGDFPAFTQVVKVKVRDH
jgi:hypothetical protein